MPASKRQPPAMFGWMDTTRIGGLRGFVQDLRRRQRLDAVVAVTHTGLMIVRQMGSRWTWSAGIPARTTCGSCPRPSHGALMAHCQRHEVLAPVREGRARALDLPGEVFGQDAVLAERR